MSHQTINHYVTTRTVKSIIKERPCIVIQSNATLAQAGSTLLKHQIHHLPVVNNEGAVVGLVTESDLRLAAESPLWHNSGEVVEKLSKKSVADIIRPNVETVTLSETILAVVKILRVRNTNGLVVIDSEETKKVVGVITRTDILDEFIRLLEPTNPDDPLIAFQK